MRQKSFRDDGFWRSERVNTLFENSKQRSHTPTKIKRSEQNEQSSIKIQTSKSARFLFYFLTLWIHLDFLFRYEIFYSMDWEGRRRWKQFFPLMLVLSTLTFYPTIQRRSVARLRPQPEAVEKAVAVYVLTSLATLSSWRSSWSRGYVVAPLLQLSAAEEATGSRGRSLSCGTLAACAHLNDH